MPTALLDAPQVSVPDTVPVDWSKPLTNITVSGPPAKLEAQISGKWVAVGMVDADGFSPGGILTDAKPWEAYAAATPEAYITAKLNEQLETALVLGNGVKISGGGGVVTFTIDGAALATAWSGATDAQILTGAPYTAAPGYSIEDEGPTYTTVNAYSYGGPSGCGCAMCRTNGRPQRMNPEAKAAWLRILDDPIAQMQQIKGSLLARHDDAPDTVIGMCAMGALLVAYCRHAGVPISRDYEPAAMAWAGLRHTYLPTLGTKVEMANDSGITFARIADAIRTDL